MRSHRRIVTAFLACAAMVVVGGGCGAPAPLDDATTTMTGGVLPRALLFGQGSERTSPLLSPKGDRIAFLASGDRGVTNLWVAPVDDISKAMPIANQPRSVWSFRWAFTNEHLLYLVDNDGDENHHLYVHSLSAPGEDDRDLTPIAGARAKIEALSDRRPTEVIVTLNDRDARFEDVHRIDIVSGKRTLLWQNNGLLSDFLYDRNLELRIAKQIDEKGEADLLYRDDQAGMMPILHVPFADTMTTKAVGLDATGSKLFLLDSRDRDTSALVELDLAPGADNKSTTTILANARADIHRVEQHPTDRRVQGALATYAKSEWMIADASFGRELEAVKQSLSSSAENNRNRNRNRNNGEGPELIDLVSRSIDDQRWLVASMRSDSPTSYWLYDRRTRQVGFLFSSAPPELASTPLLPMIAVNIPARDGLNLVSYLTLPRSFSVDAPRPVPLVLSVHGGPWLRDDASFNRTHQWLANRNYAVLSVNFRGSKGFGKRFLNAADREWGGKMQTDLLDAVAWAIKQGIADKNRIAIVGGSYGGYATLAGLAFSPETFACGVDIVGPSNLVTLLSSFPEYWKGLTEQYTRRIGDHRTEDGKRFLLERSPVTHASRITRPLLVVQGGNDPRVKQSESDQMVAALEQTRRARVTYLVYPDEGHNLTRPENRTSSLAVTEAFLAQCLRRDGNVDEPITSDDTRGSSIMVPVGADNIAQLARNIRH